MTNEVKNVPELRFPEFSGEWEENILGEVVIIKSGWSPSNFEKKDASVLLIKVDDLNYSSRMINNSKLKVNENNKYKKIKKDSIIFPKRGAAILTNKVRILGIDSYMDSNMMALEPKKINSEFLFTFIGKTGLYKIADTSTIPQINNKHIEPYNILLPSSTEQKYIGDFFSKLDRQIELEEQKLAKLEEQKKGYMQKVFSQELRFKDDNGNSYPDWSIKKIEDISKVNKGFTPNTKNDEYWDELNENWLSIAGMTQKYLYKGNKGITEKGASKHVKVDKDTLIMSFKLTLGKLAIVKEPIYTNEAICHFVWKESNVNTEYMYYYLNSINISTFGAQAVKGVTLNNDSINSIIVKLPVIQEQNKIAYFFNELDKLIRKQYAKIELLKQRKNGLLQKMFV